MTLIFGSICFLMSVAVIQGVCTNNKFGSNCAEDCDCDSTKVTADAVAANQLCDVETGACKCRSVWQGDKCQHDTDECADEDICQQFDNKACGNTYGGYFCGCLLGYEEDDNDMCVVVSDTDPGGEEPKEAEIKIPVSWKINATTVWNLNITSVYRNASNGLENKLKAVFTRSTRVVVRDVKSGSLLVEFLIFIQNVEQSKVDTTSKLEELRDGHTFELFGETVSANDIHVSGELIPSKAGSCDIYTAAFGCPSGSVCEIIDDAPRCQEIPTPKDNADLILGLGLGVLLPGIFLVIVVAICSTLFPRSAASGRKRRQRTKEWSDDLGIYEADPYHPYIFYSGRKYNDYNNIYEYSTYNTTNDAEEKYLYDNTSLIF